MSSIPTYADLGIDGKQAQRWQAIAHVPDQDFAAAKTTHAARQERHTRILAALADYQYDCTPLTRL